MERLLLPVLGGFIVSTVLGFFSFTGNWFGVENELVRVLLSIFLFMVGWGVTVISCFAEFMFDKISSGRF